MAVNTLGLAAHTTYMYYLAPIALREAGAERFDALAFSLIAVAMGAAVVPAGRLADRVPRRRVMRLGLALLASAYVGVLLPPGVAPVVFGTVATGVGLAMLFVSFVPYVADLLGAADRSGAYGRAGALAILATALGPFLAALVFRASPDALVGLRANGLLFGLGTLGGVALTFGLPSSRLSTGAREERGRWHEALRAAGPIAITYLFMGAGYGMTLPYFAVFFLDHVGLGNVAWGYLLAAGTVASAVGSLAAGQASRRFSPPRVALAGMGVMFAASLAFALPVGLALLALAFLLRYLFSTTVSPAMNATLMLRARSNRRAEAQAYTSLAWNLGWASGAAVGAALLAALGGGLFGVGAGLAFLGVAIGVVLLARG